MKNYTSLLVGCGDIGNTLACQLPAEYQCTGLRRNIDHLGDGIEGLSADYCNEASLQQALAGRTFDFAVITLTPSSYSEGGYRDSYIAGVNALINSLSVSRSVFFVSSSSVYAEDAGAIVNEESTVDAKGFSGRIMAEAEALLMASHLPVCTVRFSGIYGPGRQRLISRIRDRNFSNAVTFTNRIHRDDCAGVLAHLMQLQSNSHDLQPCYLASDNLPVLNTEVEQWMCERLGISYSSAENTTAAPSGKRCSNQRLRESGYEFIHSDFKSGYQPMLSDLNG